MNQKLMVTLVCVPVIPGHSVAYHVVGGEVSSRNAD